MKFILFFFLFFGIALPAISQQSSGNQPVTKAQFQDEINKAIAAYPNGMQLYKVSDNFEHLIYAQVAKKLGLTGITSFNKGNSNERQQSLSNASDLTPDIDDEDEASIAISRVNPNLIVAGANDLPGMFSSSMPSYVSTDAGQDWETYHLPSPSEAGIQAYSDPMLICDDSGTFYYSFMISSEQTVTFGDPFISDLMVARSTDGKNWILGAPVLGNSVPAYSTEDKETIAVDRNPSSPYHGRIYIVWTHYSDGSGIHYECLISHSTNHGVSWSAPDTIATPYDYFTFLRTGKDGDVFIGSSYRDSVTFAGSYHSIMVSHDGGSTFSELNKWPYINYPEGDYTNELKDSVKAFPYINFDVDPSNNNIFAVYGTYDSSCWCAEQFATTSADGGDSWTMPQQIGTPGLLTTDHFQPWVTFDPATGKARVVMYSSENDPRNNLLTIMVCFDFDNLTTPEALGTNLFDPNQVLGGIAYPRSAPFIGDYTGSDSYEGTFATAWTEKNPNGADGDIFARIETPSGSVSLSKINESSLALQEPSPNPVLGNMISFAATSNFSSSAKLTLFDLNGCADISTEFELTPGSSSNVNLDIHSLSSGVYRVVLTSQGQMVEKNLVILH